MTNQQARLIALPLFIIAFALVATLAKDEGAFMVGGVLCGASTIWFLMELWASYKHKD